MRSAVVPSNATAAASVGGGQRMVALVLPSPSAPSLKRPQPHTRSSVIVHSVKAVDVQDHGDMATGWRVNPEKRAAQDFNPRDILSDCADWRACAALLKESPQKFERNKTLSYFMLVKLADLLGPSPEGAAAQTRFRPPPDNSSAGQLGEGAAGGGGIGSLDPFADLLARDAAKAAKRMVGAEREAAMQLVAQVLRMAVANMDQMRGEHVCGITFTLARLGYPDQQTMKAVLLYIKAQPKRFKVAELYACLAACTAMNCRVPSNCLQAMLVQAQRGSRFLTPADMDNVAYALHVQPRGAMKHSHVNSIMRAARPRLFDMSGDSLAYLAATIARQGYRPPLGFMAGLMEALGPHLINMTDPHAVAALIYGLASLKVELNSGVTGAVERVLTSPGASGVGGLGPEELGVVGSVLGAQGRAGGYAAYSPSSQLKTMYLAAVRDRLGDVDEISAGPLLSGLAYMSKDVQPAKPPAASPPAGKQSATAARLAKLAAKKAAEAAKKAGPGGVPLSGMVSELLELVEGRLPHMGGHALQQLAAAIEALGHTVEEEFGEAFRLAVSQAVFRCGGYGALTALAGAAGAACPQLRLLVRPAGTSVGSVEVVATIDDGEELTTLQFATAVAAQAVKVSEGPAAAALSTAVPGAVRRAGAVGDGMAAAGAEGGEEAGAGTELGVPVEEEDPFRYLPSEEELGRLKEALGALQGVDVQALQLPEAAPPLPGFSRYSDQRRTGNRSRQTNRQPPRDSWDTGTSSAWFDDGAVDQGLGDLEGGGGGAGGWDSWQQQERPAYGGRSAGGRQRGYNNQADGGFGAGADGFGAGGGEPAQGGWQDDGFGQSKGWQAKGRGRSSWQDGGFELGGATGQGWQEDGYGQGNLAGTGRQGGWQDDPNAVPADGGFQQQDGGYDQQGSWGGARYIDQDAPRRRPQRETGAGRRGAEWPSVQGDEWFSGGAESSVPFGGQGDESGREFGLGRGPRAPAPLDTGFSAIDGMGDGGWSAGGDKVVGAGGGAAGWAEQGGGMEGGEEAPVPAGRSGTKAGTGKQVSQMGGGGFSGLLDDFDFGDGGSGWGPGVGGLGAGPKARGPSIDVFGEQEVGPAGLEVGPQEWDTQPAGEQEAGPTEQAAPPAAKAPRARRKASAAPAESVGAVGAVESVGNAVDDVAAPQQVEGGGEVVVVASTKRRARGASKVPSTGEAAPDEAQQLPRGGAALHPRQCRGWPTGSLALMQLLLMLVKMKLLLVCCARQATELVRFTLSV